MLQQYLEANEQQKPVFAREKVKGIT